MVGQGQGDHRYRPVMIVLIATVSLDDCRMRGNCSIARCGLVASDAAVAVQLITCLVYMRGGEWH